MSTKYMTLEDLKKLYENFEGRDSENAYKIFMQVANNLSPFDETKKELLETLENNAGNIGIDGKLDIYHLAFNEDGDTIQKLALKTKNQPLLEFLREPGKNRVRPDTADFRIAIESGVEDEELVCWYDLLKIKGNRTAEEKALKTAIEKKNAFAIILLFQNEIKIKAEDIQSQLEIENSKDYLFNFLKLFLFPQNSSDLKNQLIESLEKEKRSSFELNMLLKNMLKDDMKNLNNNGDNVMHLIVKTGDIELLKLAKELDLISELDIENNDKKKPCDLAPSIEFLKSAKEIGFAISESNLQKFVDKNEVDQRRIKEDIDRYRPSPLAGAVFGGMIAALIGLIPSLLMGLISEGSVSFTGEVIRAANPVLGYAAIGTIVGAIVLGIVIGAVAGAIFKHYKQKEPLEKLKTLEIEHKKIQELVNEVTKTTEQLPTHTKDSNLLNPTSQKNNEQTAIEQLSQHSYLQLGKPVSHINNPGTATENNVNQNNRN